MMVKRLLILFSLLKAFAVFGQISAPLALSSSSPFPNTTNYFFQSISGASLQGLNSYADGTKCIWHQFDVNTLAFSVFIKEEVGLSSTLNGIVNGGGYQLACTNGVDTTYFYCWTFEPQITTTSVVVDETRTNCSSLALQEVVTTLPLSYRNPSNLTSVFSVNYNLSYSWSSQPTGATIPAVWNPIFSQPVDSTIFYSVVIGNGLGLAPVTQTMPKAYNALGLEAAFEIVPIYETPSNNLDSVPGMGSGPYTVSFKNNSEGNYNFAEIYIYKEGIEMPVSTFEYDETRSYTFVNPGKYKVQISIANSDAKCSAISSEIVVTIPESMIGIPNTFTPNGDGINDEFRVSYISLKQYHIYIYNRWGRRLFESDDPSEGWNGSGCETGVYFYVIEAEGVDGISYNEKGPIHLLTNK